MMSFIGFVRGGLRGRRWMSESAEFLKGWFRVSLLAVY
jgi:hypothetical protein